MLGVTNIWTYLLGTVAIILLPGPNSMYVLSVAARRGVRAGYAAAGGVFLGDGLLMVLSAAGIASLLRTEPVLFTAVKYAGAGYLCWIGVGLVRGAWRRYRRPAAADPDPAGVPAGPAEPTARVDQLTGRDLFRRALLVSLANPKAILFFVSFFIQFVQPGYARPWLSFLLLGAVVEVVSFGYLTSLIFGGSYLAKQFHRRRRLARVLTTGVGAIFIAFAARLATASLS